MTRNIQNKTPCKHRYKIYETNLFEAYNALQDLGIQSKKMQNALKDQGLMIKLAEIVDEYVICGVSADLGRCRPHLEQKPPTPPNLDNIIKMSDPPKGIQNAFAASKPIEKLYKNYFDWFIYADKVIQNGTEINGRDAFYQRYPRLKHAVETSCTNFVKNIIEACQRLQNDWDTIHQFIFAADPTKSRLVKITPTGSDFHKGGKQVLIFTFKIDNFEHKLIYKPSDVELDYRLLANTTLVRQNPFHTQALGGQKSIWELTNEFLDDAFKLPTYKILPFHSGSKLDQGFTSVFNRLPIENSYGYIEYLSHNPKIIPNFDSANDVPVESDWITSDKKVVEKFYRQWGRILAIGLIFSMSDFHLDNVIVHKLQPHLIDAEIAFTGPMKDVSGTVALMGPSGALLATAAHSPKAKQPRMKDETANLIVFDDGVDDVEFEPSKDKLYLVTNGKAELTLAKNHIPYMGKGFKEVLEAFQKNKDTLIQWLTASDLEKVIARFTPMQTADFAKILRSIYAPKNSSREVSSTEEPLSTIKDKADKKWKEQKVEPGDSWPAPRPNHAIFTDDHALKDFWNCDIPAFYHRLGENALLNARGEVVKLPAETVIDREHYFPQATLSFVVEKINSLGNGNSDPLKRTNDFLLSLIDTLVPGPERAKFLRK
jgi:hypothetical protein